MPVAATTVASLKGRFWFMSAARAPGRAAARGARRRPHHGAAAAPVAAAAGEDHVDVGRIVGLALDLVVVGELLPGGDGSDRVDEHPRFLDHRLAVRLAAVIDETRIVPVDAGVDHRFVVGDEQEGVVVAVLLALVAAVGLGVRDTLSEVLDHAGALRYRPQREHAEPVQRRGPHLEQRPVRLPRAALAVRHTATGARMVSWWR